VQLQIDPTTNGVPDAALAVPVPAEVVPVAVLAGVLALDVLAPAVDFFELEPQALSKPANDTAHSAARTARRTNTGLLWYWM
jgi:hypothetical protein